MIDQSISVRGRTIEHYDKAAMLVGLAVVNLLKSMQDNEDLSKILQMAVQACLGNSCKSLAQRQQENNSNEMHETDVWSGPMCKSSQLFYG